MEKLVDKTMPGMARAEYIEVEPNVRLHITDAGEGRIIRTGQSFYLISQRYSPLRKPH